METCVSLLTQEISSIKEFRIIPSGRFRAIDGRPGNNQDWILTEEIGRKIVADAALSGQDFLIDYGHQSLKDSNAVAAGWFRELVWKPDGLYVKNAQWTEAAKKAIQSQEYRFVSPVFTHTSEFEVLNLRSIAITNTPALPQLTDLSRVSLSQIPNQNQAHASAPHFDIAYVARVLGQCPKELQAKMAEEAANAKYQYSEQEIESLARLLNRPINELRAELL